MGPQAGREGEVRVNVVEESMGERGNNDAQSVSPFSPVSLLVITMGSGPPVLTILNILDNPGINLSGCGKGGYSRVGLFSGYRVFYVHSCFILD